MLDRRQFLLSLPAAGLAHAQSASRIRQIDIVNHTHTDIGYTDAPSVVRDRQKRYLESAIDLCLNDPAYRWTVEALIELDDWWKTAAPARRDAFLRLVHSGQMDVMALPLNQTPFMNALQWRQMMSWIPATLWRSVSPRAAMQNDVNGIPRAGAMALLDKGVRYLLMGLNSDSGGPPFQRLTPFWWKMPDGRRLFVWQGEHYGRAMMYLNAPRQGFDTSEEAVRKSHERCAGLVSKLEAGGYKYERIILTFTNPAGYDNGWPYPSLARFVKAWNQLKLEPSLRLVTATQAITEMEKLAGATAAVMEGEWTDWWANGDASGPREVAASRFAKRSLAAAVSPVWGPMPAEASPSMEAILKDLCLFDEHTWGASTSISVPYSLKTLGQYVEKSELAYRPMGQAEWLLNRRMRTKIDPLPEGIYVANTAPEQVSGWAPAPGLPPDVLSVADPATGSRSDVVREGGRPRFWVERLAPNSIRALRGEKTDGGTPGAGGNATLKLDSSGWPVSALWPGMNRPLFDGSLGEFIAVELIKPANRRTITQIHANPDAEKRAEIRKKSLRQSSAEYTPAKAAETAHTSVFTQDFRHPRLGSATRTAEFWKREPRVRVNVRFDRLTSTDPELFYLAFALPEGAPMPVFSSGGMPFTPYRDQLPGSCRDYFTIDGWAHFASGGGGWLWVTRDAALTVVGGPHALERHQTEPPDHHRVLAMVFDNCWHTNFVADSHGLMEFQFDLVWRDKIANPGGLAEALAADPVVMVHTGREAPELMKNLYRP